MNEWPPKSWRDIEDYDHEEIVLGYREYREGDPMPGENRSPGFRWGWSNRAYDHSNGKDDGFAYIRHEGARNFINRQKMN